MISTVIQSSALEGHGRLDAEYYEPQWFALLAALYSAGATPLRTSVSIRKRRFVAKAEETIRYIEIADVDRRSGLAEANVVPVEEAPSRAQWIVAEGNVIVSTVRPLRNAVVLIGPDEAGAVCSSGFAVLESAGVEPEVLFAYLKARPIVRLVARYTSATMYPAVSQDDLLGVPLLELEDGTRKRITEHVQDVRHQISAYRRQYEEAERQVLTAVNWDGLEIDEPRFWVSQLRETESVARLDAEHFNPRYAQLLDHLRAECRTKRLGEITNHVRRGSQPRYVPDGEVLVLNSEHVGRRMINTEQAERTDAASYDAVERARARRGDVLFNSTGLGTIGRANCVFHSDPTVVDNHVTIIRADSRECDPRYLAVYLNSPVGRMQTDQWLSGSSGQIEIYPRDIEQFVVALPPLPLQKKVGRALEGAFSARAAAGSSMTAAIAPIEDSIKAALDRE